MEREQRSVVRSGLLEFLASNPVLLDSHSRWLSAGGDRTLDKMLETVRGDLFPYTADQHVQAAFGAWVGGVSWAVRILKNLVVLANNRKEMAELLAQAEGTISPEEREAMMKLYGYSAEDLARFDKATQPAAVNTPRPAKKKEK